MLILLFTKSPPWENAVEMIDTYTDDYSANSVAGGIVQTLASGFNPIMMKIHQAWQIDNTTKSDLRVSAYPTGSNATQYFGVLIVGVG